MIFLVILYIVLLVFGFKSTWDLAVNVALAGSSGLLLPIILFIVMILVVGPVMGIVNLIKMAFGKKKVAQTVQADQPQQPIPPMQNNQPEQ